MNNLLDDKKIIGDEHIIAAKVAAQYAIKHSILNKVVIDKKAYEFEPYDLQLVTLPDIQFSIVLPKGLEPLPDEHTKIKYPFKNRPEIILASADTKLMFTFNQSIHINEMKDYIIEYKNAIKQHHPNFAFLSEEIFDTDSGLKIAQFDFCGNAMDQDIYHLYSFVRFTDKQSNDIFCAFNCPYDLYEQWEPLFKEMIDGITVL